MLHHNYILHSDSHWGIWNGGRGDYGVALLVALVTGGYHSSAAYKWSTDGAFLGDEIYPIIYVSKRGTYICTCTFASVEMRMKFIVYGGIIALLYNL